MVALSTLSNLDEGTPTGALWGRRAFLLLVLLAVVADWSGSWASTPPRGRHPVAGTS